MIDSLSRLREASFDPLALSLYLPGGPAVDDRYYEALLKDLQREEERRLDDRGVRALRRELPQVRNFLSDRPPARRPLAAFSCEPVGFFEAYWLPEEVETQLFVGERLEVVPLFVQARRYPPAWIVVVDKERARVFRAFLGNVEEIAHLEGEPIKLHKQGGWSAEKHQRHEEQLAHWQLKAAAEWLSAQDPNGKNRLYLGGPVEARSDFKRALPKVLANALAGEFAAPLYSSSGELAERLKKETRESSRRAARSS